MKMFKMTTGGGQALLRSKQGAAKKALLYILTPIFCVALLCGTVFSFSKTDKISANAAESEIRVESKPIDPISCVKINYYEHKVLFTGIIGDEVVPNLYNDQFEGSVSCITYNGSFTGSNTASVTSNFSTNSEKNQRAITVVLYAEITVPAGATYKVSYTTSGSVSKTKDDSMGFGAVIGYIGEDDSEIHSCSYYKCGIPVLTDNIAMKNNPGGASISLNPEPKELVYKNTDSDAKKFKSYFVFAAGARSIGNILTVSNSFNITATSVTEEYINAPANLSTTYDGQNHWINSFSDSWIKDYHSNENVVAVKNISYKPNVGETQDLGTVTSNIKNAGVYTVKIGIAEGFNRRWSDETITEKTFTITINKDDPVVDPQYEEPENWYESGGLPVLTNKSMGTPGTFSYGDQSASASKTSYTWTFTPTNANNYNTKTGTINFNFIAAQIDSVKFSVKDGATVYDAYSLTELKKYLTVTAVYDDGKEAATSDYTVTTADGKLTVDNNGECSITVRLSDGTKLTSKIPVTKSEIEEIEVECTETFTYPVTYDEILEAIDVYIKWNYNNKGVKVTDNSVLELTGTIAVGTPTLTVKYKGVENDGQPFTVTINKGTLTPTVTFEGLTATYDGSDKKIEATVSGLPEGVTLVPTYTVTGSATAYVADGYANAGTYNYSVSFAHDNPNYEQYTTPSTATLQIDKATVKGIVFEGDSKPEITGTTYTLEATGYPEWVTVEYYCNGTLFTGASAAGNYEITAKFTIDDDHKDNYLPIGDMTKTLSISDKPPVAGADDIVVETTISATYTGSPVDYSAKNVPSGVSVSYEILKDGAAFESTEIIEVGEYTVTVKFETAPDKAPIADKTCVVTISKADFDIASYVTFSGKTVAYDGNEYTLVISGELPEWIEVSYEVEGQDGTAFSDVGTYNFKAKFTHENGNYKEIGDMPATLKITTAGVALDVTFEDLTVTYDGENHTIEIDGTLPAWVSVTYYVGEEEFTGAVDAGTYEVVARFTVDTTMYEQPEEMTATLTIKAAAYELIGVTFENGAFVYDGEAHSIFIGGTLPEWITVTYTGNEVTEIGTHTVTAKFTHENGNYSAIEDMTAQIVISKAKVALPVYKGTLSYSGDEIKPAAADFDGFDSAIMALVESKTVAGLNAGAYKAVFALKDSDRYEWATATTLKKTVFAAVVYEQVILEDYEAAVDWNLAKAKISATKANGKLPVFASESYTGSLADIVDLKYYTDETCTEEISADELAYSTKYYVKAQLLDGANFELDETAVAFSKTAFEYTTPEKQLTVWEKIVKFVVTNWLWLVIAVVALILFITLIALLARAAKKKREREERRLAEEKEEKKREQEERRLEREERMARMSQQQQAMPQMMMPQMMPQMMGQMPQQMPQSAPQAAQPVATGGGSASDAQFAQIQSELAAMRAEQAAMRTEVAMRAEQAAIKAEQSVMHSEIYAMRGGEQTINGGISLDKLTEIIRTEVKNAMANEKAAAQATPAAPEGATPVTAQVPPDAVMTTVTTTKIDTTKKSAQPAQNAQAQAAPVRTVVRNVVAPMPVDDGRVFDVGGFYKPADPLTDIGFTDEEKD